MDKKGLIIKKVTEADAERIWQLRNAPQVRIKSNNTEKINYKDHLTWFKKKYLDVNKNFCFVLKKEALLIGYCRFDREKDSYLVSIAIDPKLHGQGLGNFLLKGALTELKTDKKVLAEIKKGNIASAKLFLRNNFEIFKIEEQSIFLKFNPGVNPVSNDLQLYELLLKQKPKKSNCLVWLQGDRFNRGHKVLELFRKKISSKIIISGNNVLLDKHNLSTGEMRRWLIKNGVEPEKIVMDNISMNTKDQARNVINLAKKKRWKNITIVGSSYHQPRAFLTFLKQAQEQKWQGRLINQPAILKWDEVPDGGNKTTGEYLEEEFAKIKKYKKDVATKEAGIEYLLKSL